MDFDQVIVELRSIDFKNGQVRSLADFLTVNSDQLQKDKFCKDQVEFYTEDLISARYEIDGASYVIDVGCYGNSDISNAIFRTVVVKNGEWDTPLFDIEFKEFSEMRDSIDQALSYVDNLQLTNTR